MKIKNILWDLDGTLTDPKVGIVTCIQYALEKFGAPVPEMDDLLWCIGPPLSEAFKVLIPSGNNPTDVNTLIELYRERFASIGKFENLLYTEIPDILKNLNQAHYLATSKPHIYAREILVHFNLDTYFSAIHGSELNGVRSNKGELIEYILETESLNPQETVMIGDRKHDILGAKKAGVRSIGITWGYGSKQEHLDACADHVFNEPQELNQFLQQAWL